MLEVLAHETDKYGVEINKLLLKLTCCSDYWSNT